jgi:hypothetical protein
MVQKKASLMIKPSLIMPWIKLFHRAKRRKDSVPSKPPIRLHNAMHNIHPSENQGLTERI